MGNVSEENEINILRSKHVYYFPMLAHLYQVQEYSHCISMIRRIQQEYTKNRRPIPSWYNGQYLMLSAICEPEAQAAQLANFQARHTFQTGYGRREWLTEQMWMFLEVMTFISKLVQTHLGGIDRSDQPPKHMDKNVEEWLRGRTLRELGLEVFMVHYALVRDVKQRIVPPPERPKDGAEESKKLDANTTEPQQDARSTGPEDPQNVAEPRGLAAPQNAVRLNGQEDPQNMPQPTGPGKQYLEPLRHAIKEGNDFNVEIPSPEEQMENGFDCISIKHRRDYTEALSLEELEEADYHRNRLFPDPSTPGDVLTPNGSQSTEEQQWEGDQETQDESDLMVRELRSVLQNFGLDQA